MAPAIAPEHALRLLHAIDTDLDELITLEDLQAYAHRHNLAFRDEEMAAMFEEANVSRDGLLDIEQLTKAASGNFSHRKHNETWRRLFAEAPGEREYGDSPIRQTELLEPLPQQSAIRASYEQEEAVLTFAPNTSASQLSNSASRKTLTFPRTQRSSASTAPTTQDMRTLAKAPTLRPFAAGRPGVGEDADENHINGLIQPATSEEDMDASAPPKPLRCGFDAKAAFEARVASTKHASDADGWRDRLPVQRPPRPSRFYYGVHSHEFDNLTTLHNGKLPLRADGALLEGKFVAPLRVLITENSGVGMHNSKAHRERAMPSDGNISEQEFRSVFKRRSIQQEKMSVATDRLAQEGTVEYPRPNQYAFGKPSPYNFRDEISRIGPRTLINGKPDFVTAAGSYWPRNELRPPAVVTMTVPGEPALRLGATENLQPGNARSGWAPAGPRGTFA